MSRRLLARGAVICGLLLAGASVGAQENAKVVGGYAIYLGVLPAELVQGHPPDHPERKMHGGAPARRGQQHIVVSVFEAASGARVDNAVVTAKVGEPGLSHVKKRLEPMPIAGAASYGGYFDMAAPGSYRIELRIDRPGAASPVTATFTYNRPR